MFARVGSAVIVASFAVVGGPARGAGPPVDAAGDPAVGRALFVGATPFENGGSPCGACHGIAGEGPGVKASFGPDLSEAYATFGADALASMLEDLPFPSMAPVYAGRSLTARERTDLAAFLAAAGGRAPARESAWFPIHAGLLAVAGVFGLAMAGRRRKGSSRARLLGRFTAGKEAGR
jgi:mono/diheme cytochrome c family protein